MSLGKTDKMWWKKISDWLIGNPMRRLIIYSYKKEGHRNDVYSENNCRREILDKFKSVADVNEEKWKEIQDRILTNENPKLFDFKLVGKPVTGN